ncbi:MAG: DUF3108 domain-containing protein [Puniceicoccaceae bacterium]
MSSRLIRFSIVLAAIQTLKAGEGPVPFHPGEKLEYNLSWGVFNVGKAVLEIHPMKVFEDQTCWHLTLNVRTNGFADAIYRVRSSFESYLSEDLSRTVWYRKVQREGGTNRDIEVRFDWENSTAQSIKYERGKTTFEEPIVLPGPTHDPLGALFAFRQYRPTQGVDYPLRITDGKKVIDLVINSNRSQEIKVDAGKFKVLRFLPDTKDLSGVFQKSADSAIQIWFEEKNSFAPVQVQGKVSVGNFRAKLENLRRRTI